jgi:hypothetical protein
MVGIPLARVIGFASRIHSLDRIHTCGGELMESANSVAAVRQPKDAACRDAATILGGLRLIVPALALFATAQSDRCLMAGQRGCLLSSGIAEPSDYISWGFGAYPNSDSLLVLGLSGRRGW